MLTSSLQSTPCATPEAANDMLGGMLQAATGKGEEIKVISTDIREVDGMWIAIAFFEISQPDAEEDGDEEVGPHEEKSETDRFEMNDDNDVALWHGLTHQQVSEVPSGQDIPELKDTDAARIAPEAPVFSDNTSPEDNSTDLLAIGVPSQILIADPLQEEFKKAEEASDLAGIKKETYADDRTFEERREEAEREADEEELIRLERLRAEAVDLQPDLPTVDPAPPQG